MVLLIFFKKPFSPEELKYRIRSLLELIKTNESKITNELNKTKEIESWNINQAILIDNIDKKIDLLVS